LGVHVHQHVPGRRARRVGIERAADPGVVHEDVELAERRHGRLHRGLPIVLARDVELHEPRLPAARRDLLGHLAAVELEHVGHDDAGAFPREDRRLALTHAARSARDERYLTRESHTHASFVYRRATLMMALPVYASVPPSIADSTGYSSSALKTCSMRSASDGCVEMKSGSVAIPRCPSRSTNRTSPSSTITTPPGRANALMDSSEVARNSSRYGTPGAAFVAASANRLARRSRHSASNRLGPR